MTVAHHVRMSARAAGKHFDEPRRKGDLPVNLNLLKGSDMNRNFASALATGTIAVLAAAAAAAMTFVTTYADDITVEKSEFVSSLSRDEVSAELKTPYPGGNPWSSSYNLLQAQSKEKTMAPAQDLPALF